MKRFFFVLASLGLSLGYTACERQDWEETRKLRMGHGPQDEHHSEHVKETPAPATDAPTYSE